MPTVPKPPDNSELANRRQVLAFIALADIPMPESIRFYDQHPLSLDIDPGDDLDLTPLMALFGAPGREVRRQRYDSEKPDKHGFILMINDIQWRGWSVGLRGWATDGKTGPADEELDADTRARLEEVAAPAPEISDRAADAIADLFVADAKLRGYEDPAIAEYPADSVTDAANEPIPFVHQELGLMPGYVVGCCGHRVAESEWRAGFRVCEQCPEPDGSTS